MGELIFHFDREPIDDQIRADYKYEKNGVTYLIENIPCIRLPFVFKEIYPEKDVKSYLMDDVYENLSIIIHLQQNEEDIPNEIDYMEIEELLNQ